MASRDRREFLGQRGGQQGAEIMRERKLEGDSPNPALSNLLGFPCAAWMHDL